MGGRSQLEQAIAAQESLRGLVDDAVIEATVQALRGQLALLDEQDGVKRRKQVTVLFADISGFTAMSETMDAEDVSDTFDLVWEQLDAAITAHSGLIDKHIGDAVMGLWSVDDAREDDPEQAVKAALAMQSVVLSFAESDSAHLADLKLRIGVNTGPVVLGSVGTTAEFTAIGDTVNVAARLESAAPVGGVLIGYDTYRHVKGIFTVFEQESLEVKGKRLPLRTFVVEDIQPRGFRLRTRGVEGIETRMIGRSSELDELKTFVSAAVDEQKVHLVGVIGEAGIGKSRLLYELEDWLHVQPGEMRVFKGRASRQQQGVPYSLARNVFSFQLQIAENDPNTVAVGKLEIGITEILGEESLEQAHLIGHLIGLDLRDSEHIGGILDDPKQLRDRGFRAFSQVFEAIATERPMIVLLEDVHWADQGSLELIQHVVDHCSDLPLFLMAVARPTLYERYPGWGEGHAGWHRIDLGPLSESDIALMVEEILRKVPMIPVEIATKIVSAAEGNPFYVEELIKMMIEDGVIVASDDVWYAEPARLTSLNVPPTLTGVVQARLDLLPSRERDVLGRASIVGRIFWDGAIPPAGDSDEPDTTLAQDLESLERKDLIYADDDAHFAGTDQYVFKHAILHDVTYESVLKRLRRLYHRRVADWLAGRDEATSYAALIASHYSHADAVPEAAHWHAVAAIHAQARYANRDAARYYRLALEPGGLELHDRLPLYDGLREVLMLQALYDEALETNAAWLEAAREAEDVGSQARAVMRMAAAHLRQGDAREAVAIGEEAERLVRSQSPRNDRIFCEVLTQVGWGLLRVGELDSGLAKGEEALAIAETAGDSGSMWRVQALLGSIRIAKGDHNEAAVNLERTLLLNQELGDRVAEGRALINLGELARIQGDFGRAVELYRRALAIQRDLGDVDQEPLTLSNIGGALVGRAAFEGALDYLKKAAEAFDASGGSEHVAETYRFMAEASLGLGAYEDALSQAIRSYQLATQDGSPDHLGHSWRVLGLVGRRLERPISVPEIDGSYNPAECFSRAAASFADSGMEADRAMTLWDWADFELVDGDPQLGKTLWAEAREVFEGLGLPRFVAGMDEEEPASAE